MVATKELADRLRSSRERAGITQEQAADAVGLPRTAVVKIENGDRAVSSLELVKLAKLFGRDINELLAEEFSEDAVAVLFRASPQLAQPELSSHVVRCINLCRELASLEDLLGMRPAGPLKVSYDLPPPRSKWDAIQEGRRVAAAERGRLGLGDAPVWELVEVLRSQGIRAAEFPLPADISGLSFVGQKGEPIIIVNRNHPVRRRLYSFAHEYAHRLIDRKAPSVYATEENEKSPVETRADVFAAHLLLPPSGVENFLAGLGKAKDADLQLPDVVVLAHYFGVSFKTAVYQLGNLKIINTDQRDVFLREEETAKAIGRALGRPKLDDKAHWDLLEQVVVLGLEAHRKGEITRRKLLQLVQEASPEDSSEPLRNVEALLGTS